MHSLFSKRVKWFNLFFKRREKINEKPCDNGSSEGVFVVTLRYWTKSVSFEYSPL